MQVQRTRSSLQPQHRTITKTPQPPKAAQPLPRHRTITKTPQPPKAAQPLPRLTSACCACRAMPVSNVQEMCVIVDENNNIVDAQPRNITVRNRLLGRGSYVLLLNPQQQLFVSKRSTSKDVYPGYLDVVISGVVTVGEEYIDTAARELEEEVGIPQSAARLSLQQLFIFPYKDDVCHVWGAAFAFTWDGPVSFPDKEVEWGRFMSLEEVERELEASQFTPVGRHILSQYLKQQQQGQSQQQEQWQQQEQQREWQQQEEQQQ